MSAKGLDNQKQREALDMAVLSKPVNQAFVVRSDRAEEFINHKNTESLEIIKRVAEGFLKSINDSKTRQN